MDVLASQVRTDSAEFQSNRSRMTELVADLRRRIETVREGGGARQAERHRALGKMVVRDRIARLIDPGTPFLELSALAASGMYDDGAPAAGIVTGIGRVNGHEVVIVANDATVKGGTYYPITVKKHI